MTNYYFFKFSSCIDRLSVACSMINVDKQLRNDVYLVILSGPGAGQFSCSLGKSLDRIPGGLLI